MRGLCRSIRERTRVELEERVHGLPFLISYIASRVPLVPVHRIKVKRAMISGACR